MLFHENQSEIETAKKGSDIYSLVERVAYMHYLSNPSRNEEDNWFSAQKDVAFWSVHKWSCGMKFPDDLKYFLQDIAHRIESNSSFLDWCRALDIAADDVKSLIPHLKRCYNI